MDIALQNELDNIRAQLSQKGELARDRGLWVLVGEVLEGRPPSFWQSQGLFLLCMSKSLASSCDWQEREVTEGHMKLT